MEFILRKACLEDDDDIRALVRRVRINPADLDWRRFWIAADPENGRLLGCGQIKPHPDGSYELASIAVQPEFQGSGIGSAIMEKLLAGPVSPRPLYLMCRANMQPYYQKFGFREVNPAEVTPYFRTLWRIFSILKSLPILPKTMQGRIMIKPG
jgi:N-acetylglutamate synthase-like GNAT family acetyltransferase